MLCSALAVGLPRPKVSSGEGEPARRVVTMVGMRDSGRCASSASCTSVFFPDTSSLPHPPAQRQPGTRR